MHILAFYLLPVLAILGWSLVKVQPPRHRPLRVDDLLGLSIVPFDLRQRDHHVIAPSDSAVLHCWPTNNLFGR